MGATKAAFLSTSLLVIPSGGFPDIGHPSLEAVEWSQAKECAAPCQREMFCIFGIGSGAISVEVSEQKILVVVGAFFERVGLFLGIWPDLVPFGP